MKTKTANLMIIVFSLSLAIGLLGCQPRGKIVDAKQSQSEAEEKGEKKAEKKAESEIIADSTKGTPESFPSDSEEISKETTISADQTIDTMPNELIESENSSLAFINETQSLAKKSEQPIEKYEDLSEVVKATPELIRKVQQALADAGFNPGAIDGKSGAKTITALKNFQKQNNLTVGQLTKGTLQKLNVSYQ
ncbi:peptidoglycan-binding domain-containing protein [Nitrosomonas sp. Is37]|uniref:peptidoglycan-binding domain-containing protein n=1 Tax=Nitrosomonas sp. Is37 TaxID=3080535 RepID=UPI00294B846A|nr:peptidoglycan-binding domain-containing protein [Nitrosomonas sp. Is37]MDV6344485.1 peptidoglycan-binding domain-containing protein [Nitrosomonas sp. Is37]